MSLRKLTACVALVSLLGLVQAGPAAGHVKRFKTHVEAAYDFSQNELTGSVESSRACESRRRVRVYHVSGATGDRTLTDSTKTDPGGNWTAHPDVVPTLGDLWDMTVLALIVLHSGEHIHRCLFGRLKIAA